MRSCSPPPGAGARFLPARRQCYCPSCSSHRIQGHPGPTGRCARHHCPQRTPTSLLPALAVTRKDGRVCSVGGSAPSLPASPRVPLQTPRIHLAQTCQDPPTHTPIPLHTAAIHHPEHISPAAASRTKRERKALMFPSQPRSWGWVYGKEEKSRGRRSGQMTPGILGSSPDRDACKQGGGDRREKVTKLSREE